MRTPKVKDAVGWLQSAKEKLLSLPDQPEERKTTERPRVGLALAGGFARRIAHIALAHLSRRWSGLARPPVSRISDAGLRPGSAWLQTSEWRNFSPGSRP